MRKDFVNQVARTQSIKRADLIEKDLILHQLLFDLSKNKFFHDNFAFKGGHAWLSAILITLDSQRTSTSLGRIRAFLSVSLRKRFDVFYLQLSIIWGKCLKKSLRCAGWSLSAIKTTENM